MTLLTVFIIWIIALLLIVVLNARYWTLYPDMEDKQHQADKSLNISPINPILQDAIHAVKIFVFIGIIFIVVWLVLNSF